MTDAELEQLYSDRTFAERQLHKHQSLAEAWERRRYHLTERIYEALKARNNEMGVEMREGSG